MIVTILEAAKWGTPGINGTNKFFCWKNRKKNWTTHKQKPPRASIGTVGWGPRRRFYSRVCFSPSCTLCVRKRGASIWTNGQKLRGFGFGGGGLHSGGGVPSPPIPNCFPCHTKIFALVRFFFPALHPQSSCPRSPVSENFCLVKLTNDEFSLHFPISNWFLIK